MNISNLRAAQLAVKDNPGLEIFDKLHPRSVYNIVPDYVKKSMDSMPKEYMILSENQLEKEVKPDVKLDSMRIAFWLEYQRAQAAAVNMNMANVYSPFIAASTFNERIVPNHLKLAWILTPPTDWIAGMLAILDKGVKVMHEVVSAPVVYDYGEVKEVNVKLLNQVLKVIDKATVAVHGLPVLKSETKSVNVNLNSTSTNPTNLDLEEKRKELERLRAEKAAIPVIGVKVEDE